MSLSRTQPLSYKTESAVATTGVAIALPTTVTARQVKLYVTELAYVGFGDDDSPTAIAAGSAVAYQEANTEVVYTFNNPAFVTHLWVYAVSGTITTVRASFFG
jgi:hypothetical protein